MSRWRSSSGQASVELIGGVPLVLIVGLIAMQLLAVGHAAVLAGNAAEAGALALAAGADARVGAREALPDVERARMSVAVSGGAVEVRLRPPSLFEALARRFEVTAVAAIEDR